MNLNEIYQNVASFWNEISPILFFHLIGGIVIIWSYGSGWKILKRIESFLKSDTYNRWKIVLDEFELRSKLPFLLIIFLLFYLAVFNDLLRAFNTIPGIAINYSETDFWTENHPREVLELSFYGPGTDVTAFQLGSLKIMYLEKYRTESPDIYESWVAWIFQFYWKWLNYYTLSLLFVILLIFLTILRVRKKGLGWGKSILKLTGVLFLTLLAIIYFRYRAEQYIEMRVRAELNFVVNELQNDPQVQRNRLDDQSIRTLEEAFKSSDFELSDYSPTITWWSRILERYFHVRREFPNYYIQID